MDREFKSKVGWWYHLTLAIMAITTALSFIGGSSPLTMITLLLVTLLCVHMLLSTWYKITADGWLILHCSIFPEKRIAIAEITAIEATTNFVSSYTLSLNRLMIWVDNKPWMLISPSNPAEFVKLLCKQNPNITVNT